jgi:PTH1 family peptidyl-tRNA hydrolase
LDLLLVGLGNPGPRYSLTRHNAGFIFADYLAHGLGLSFQQKSSWQAEYASGEWMNSKIHILKLRT